MIIVWNVPATVLDVVDGDTVRLELDLGWHIHYTARVRIAGIDSPEMKTAPGAEAKAFAQTLLKPGDQVMFQSAKLDKYGRPLGHVHFGSGGAYDFGAAMVEHGHAITVDW